MINDQKFRYFPIGLFTSVMGFAGVTLAINHAEVLYGFNSVISLILLGITSFLFVLNSGVLIYRLIRYKEDVQGDFNHPVKMNFFGAISISLLLLAVAYIPISEKISFALWIIGTIMQLSLTIIILSKLIWYHNFQLSQFNPTWFIPIVGNIIVPIAGTFHVGVNINWMFFSIGLFFSIVYMAIFFNRMFFHPSLPGKLLPTFYILMAPPAIGFVSYIKIATWVDSFAYILYVTAFFIGLLLLSQVKRFASTPFSIVWWAFLFPSAAMTLATVHLYTFNGDIIFRWLFNIQVIVLIILTIYLTVKTLQLFVQNKLCLKE